MACRTILFALVLAAPAWAECPAAPDISAQLDALVDEARTAPNERAGQDVSGRMWQQWLRAPDAQAQSWLEEGMERRRVFDFAGAIAAFDALVAYCPDYAEGYNQRAFVHFLREDHDAALVDLDKTLSLQPRHVGALTGKGLTLFALDRVTEGQDAIRAAVELNPWVSERRLLDVAPAPDGIEL